MNSEFETPQIQSILETEWYKLSADTRAQHILSNSELYQKVSLMQQLLADFKRLEQPHIAP